MEYMDFVEKYLPPDLASIATEYVGGTHINNVTDSTGTKFTVDILRKENIRDFLRGIYSMLLNEDNTISLELKFPEQKPKSLRLESQRNARGTVEIICLCNRNKFFCGFDMYESKFSPICEEVINVLAQWLVYGTHNRDSYILRIIIENINTDSWIPFYEKLKTKDSTLWSQRGATVEAEIVYNGDYF